MLMTFAVTILTKPHNLAQVIAGVALALNPFQEKSKVSLSSNKRKALLSTK